MFEVIRWRVQVRQLKRLHQRDPIARAKYETDKVIAETQAYMTGMVREVRKWQQFHQDVAASLKNSGLR